MRAMYFWPKWHNFCVQMPAKECVASELVRGAKSNFVDKEVLTVAATVLFI
jgi:hypothetical protein